MLASLGKNPTDEYLEGMMNEAPGPINFTMFLTLFGERLQGEFKQLLCVPLCIYCTYYHLMWHLWDGWFPICVKSLRSNMF